MPHIIIKLATGKTEEQKTRLSEAIVHGAINTLGVEADAVSVAIEEIRAEDWTGKVFLPDIRGAWNRLCKKPGYDPLKK